MPTEIRIRTWRSSLRAFLDSPITHAADRVVTASVIGAVVFGITLLASVAVFIALGNTKDQMDGYRVLLLGIPSVIATLAAGASLRKGLRGTSVVLDIVFFVGEMGI